MATKQIAPKAIRFKESQLTKLKELGEKEDRSLNWLVVRAVDKFLEDYQE